MGEISRASIRASVDLPEPLSPTTAVTRAGAQGQRDVLDGVHHGARWPGAEPRGPAGPGGPGGPAAWRSAWSGGGPRGSARAWSQRAPYAVGRGLGPVRLRPGQRAGDRRGPVVQPAGHHPAAPARGGARAGAAVRQRSSANSQRGWNTHPAGSSRRSGGEPGMPVIRRRGPCRAGNELSSPSVYGWRGERNSGGRLRLLDHPARVHHRDGVGDLDQQRQVMGDEQDGEAEPVAQLGQLLQDLPLGHHVQGRGRLVHDHDLRLQRPGPSRS